jgi:hypothetical protein
VVLKVKNIQETDEYKERWNIAHCDIKYFKLKILNSEVNCSIMSAKTTSLDNCIYWCVGNPDTKDLMK